MIDIKLCKEDAELLKNFLLYFSMEEYNGFLGGLNSKREDIDNLLIDIYNKVTDGIESMEEETFEGKCPKCSNVTDVVNLSNEWVCEKCCCRFK